MNVAGIIAEYNPFHNGHAYHIHEVKKRTNADFVIAIISGDFVQRGAPAIADKYVRTKMALLGGADLVIELPVCAATASAETFARTGVNILSQTGVVTHLGFGCETDDLALLSAIADLFTEEPAAFKEALSSYLKEGVSFPAARARAAETYFQAVSTSANMPKPSAANGSDLRQTPYQKNISDILNNPNNILAIEYLKAIKLSGSAMKPCAVKRKGAGYHSTDSNTGYCSATAIRNLLTPGVSPASQEPDTHLILQKPGAHPLLQKPGAHPLLQSSGAHPSGLSSCPASITAQLATRMPPACAKEFAGWLKQYPPVTENDFSSLLHYKLLLGQHTQTPQNTAPTPACDPQETTAFIHFCRQKENTELENRIENLLEQYTSFSDFIQLLKTKDRTYTAISRHLLHTLLDIRPDHTEALKQTDYAPYIRILGFKKNASPLLAALKKSSIPVIMRLAEDVKDLAPAQRSLLDTDIRSAHIYNAVLTKNTDQKIKNEYRHPLVYL